MATERGATAVRKANVPVRRSYRFRLAGMLYLSVTAFLAVAAISSQNNLLFWCLGLATAGIAVSGVVSGAGLVGVRVEREAIPDATAGGAFRVRYRVENVNRLVPAYGLVIFERTPMRRRRVTRPWQQFVGRPVAYVAAVGAGQVVVADAETVAIRRGEPEFTDFHVSSSFPFGLATKTMRFAQHRSGLVYPEPARVDPAVLRSHPPGAERAAGARRKNAAVGEFFGLREYLSGDPMRSIAWKPSARLEQWVTKRHAEPAPSLIWVMLDVPSDTEADLLERTMSLAAGVIKSATSQGLQFGMLSAGLGIALPPASGDLAMRRALRSLALADPERSLEPNRHAPLKAPGPRDLIVRVVPTASGDTRSHRVLAADTPERWNGSARPSPRGGRLRA